MSAYGSSIVSTPGSGWLYDFDLVTLDGRPLLVGTCDLDHRVCSWDPIADRWAEHPLRNAAQAEGVDYTELTALGAAVVDGRIVIGGGGAHQGFAMWDLETGAVRLHEEEGGVGSVTVADVDGRPMFLVGSADGPGIALWDPSASERGDSGEDWRDAISVLERPSVYDYRVEIDELESASYASSAVAAGTISGRRALLGGGRDRVLVWDIDRNRVLREFPLPFHAGQQIEPTDFALVSVDDRVRVLAAGGNGLLLGDPETGAWSGDGFELPGDGISCLDAGVIDGRAIAVTGAEDGTIHVWDLAERRMLGQPLREHDHVVYGVRIAELEGRPVLISTAHGDAVRVWDCPR